MQEEYFPVPLDGMGAQINFLQSPEDLLQVENAFIRVVRHNHPGGANSFRIQDQAGKSVVYCTDIEHGERVDPAIVKLAQGADLLIHEGQYTPEELPAHKGWGTAVGSRRWMWRNGPG